MKRRIRKIANFFAFNLLFFALYLNFIHKDKSGLPAASTQTAAQQNTAAFSGTVLVDNPELIEKKSAALDAVSTTEKNQPASTEALKLSIN